MSGNFYQRGARRALDTVGKLQECRNSSDVDRVSAAEMAALEREARNLKASDAEVGAFLAGFKNTIARTRFTVRETDGAVGNRLSALTPFERDQGEGRLAGGDRR